MKIQIIVEEFQMLKHAFFKIVNIINEQMKDEDADTELLDELHRAFGHLTYKAEETKFYMNPNGNGTPSDLWACKERADYIRYKLHKAEEKIDLLNEEAKAPINERMKWVRIHLKAIYLDYAKLLGLQPFHVVDFLDDISTQGGRIDILTYVQSNE